MNAKASSGELKIRPSRVGGCCLACYESAVDCLASAARKAVWTMNKVLNFAAVAEVATGLGLLIVPSLVGQLLLGEQLTGVAIPVARVAGIALIALGIACWPGPPLAGMLIYSGAVTLNLAYLGFAGLTGVLLWPAVILHMILTALLARNVIRRDVSGRA
jgi:hypothetical protein